MTAKTAKTAKTVMVCGTTSSAGKSFLATALCRWYARRGLKVAPYKSQNMSNNARVVADGEMGSAQYFQAMAAGRVPEVRMNPILLKPERDDRSQVILLGQRNAELSTMAWRSRSERMWPTARTALHELMAENDVLVIEGAGSPAEINLHGSDIANMRVAREAKASVLLVSDIDRGGSFAHLFGTHQLLPANERALIRGFVLNKFRGDARLLAPGPEMLKSLTGVPIVGVLPLKRDHGLPEEDGVFDAAPQGDISAGTAMSIVVVAYPRLSNLDEFQPLNTLPGVQLRWARDPKTVAGADLLILPGSKHVAEDLRWLEATGMAAAIRHHASADKPLLAICGGLQMLGLDLQDPHGVEGSGAALGLWPMRTRYDAEKIQRRARHTLHGVSGHWRALEGVAFDAYEIRHGRSTPVATSNEPAPVAVLPDGAGWQLGNTLALYTHGLFENTEVMRALFGAHAPSLDDCFDGLADLLDEHMDTGFLGSLIE